MTDAKDYVEQIDEFSPDELALAQQELAALTPAEYLAMSLRLDEEEQKEVAALENMPEVGGIIFCELVNEAKGYAFHLTARGVDTVAAIRNLARGIRFAKSMYGWKIKQSYTPRPADQQPGPSVTPPIKSTQKVYLTRGSVPPIVTAKPAIVAPPAVVASTVPPEPVYEDTEENRKAPSSTPLETGTDVLNKIKVDEGKIEFSVGKFTYPFTDSRGAEVVAKLFDADIGFTPEHFIDGAKFEPDQWGGVLYADWEKVVRFSKMKKKDVNYYNVVRVHR